MKFSSLLEMEKFFHEKIPITRPMGVRVVAHADGFAVEAPVAPHKNHLQTAFGGSINTMATLAAYGLLWQELRHDARVHVVIAESSIRFLQPVREIIRAVCLLPSPEKMTAFQGALLEQHRARISLEVRVEEEGRIAAEFAGTFVAVGDSGE